jgi:hypothetical protein
MNKKYTILIPEITKDWQGDEKGQVTEKYLISYFLESSKLGEEIRDEAWAKEQIEKCITLGYLE